ncbi:hypothetical protein HYU17_04075 [Candidatus Woesearchaeota archaeon]|nr:hypothetical protein [Candidatus Woesearchaeota archaeon]
MLTVWKKMKDREELIKEELRLFGSSETLEMLAGGYNVRIGYDPDAGRVRYSSESCLPCRQQLAQFSLEAKRMGFQVTPKNVVGKRGARGTTLEFLMSSEKTEIKVASAMRPGKEVIARTTVEFPYSLSLGTAYLLYRLADLYSMDDLEEFPIGLKPEELKEYLEGYLTDETAADANLRDMPQDIPKPFRQLIDGLEF